MHLRVHWVGESPNLRVTPSHLSSEEIWPVMLLGETDEEICFTLIFFPQLRGRSSVLFGKSKPWFWTWRLVKFVKSIRPCKREKRRMSGVPDGFFFCNFIPTICSHWLKHSRFLFIMEAVDGNERGTYWYPAEGTDAWLFWKSQEDRENWHLSNHQKIQG